jgi:hypothetical protein
MNHEFDDECGFHETRGYMTPEEFREIEEEARLDYEQFMALKNQEPEIEDLDEGMDDQEEDDEATHRMIAEHEEYLQDFISKCDFID